MWIVLYVIDSEMRADPGGVIDFLMLRSPSALSAVLLIPAAGSLLSLRLFVCKIACLMTLYHIKFSYVEPNTDEGLFKSLNRATLVCRHASLNLIGPKVLINFPDQQLCQ